MKFEWVESLLLVRTAASWAAGGVWSKGEAVLDYFVELVCVAHARSPGKEGKKSLSAVGRVGEKIRGSWRLVFERIVSSRRLLLLCRGACEMG